MNTFEGGVRMPGVAETIVGAYLIGSAILGPLAFWGVLRHDRSIPRAMAVGVGVGAAWPLVLFGVAQWLLIAATMDATGYVARSRLRRAPPAPRHAPKPSVPSNA